MGFMDADFQIVRRFTHNSVVDLTGATADIVEFPVLEGKIQILGVDLIATDAFPNSVTMTTRPEVSVDRVNIADATRDELGFVIPDYSQAHNEILDISFNPYADDIHTPAEFPTAVRGDVIVLEHKVQGIGGTQKAKFSIAYRELQS